MRSALLLALLLAGCASTTELVTRSVTPTPPPPPRGVLLVAQTPENDTRETWELTCRPIFQRAGLEVFLSHQELPLWDEKGRAILVDWAHQHGVERVLVVDLTYLIQRPPHLTEPRDHNPISQGEVEPTWRIGIGGKIKEEPQPEAEQRYPVDLLSAEGRNLWNGEARTHEANDQSAIAKSQCRALAAGLGALDLL
ncbi:hypothetical protein [Alloalcanivorax mobilis]|uniref:hypothetical protein n=1 Tax=Alloalcanivorax mobilis TaxID=2019569 RepID=UPI000C783409|nr:hypothetical protein [Alloalcanivorax mobilis]